MRTRRLLVVVLLTGLFVACSSGGNTASKGSNKRIEHLTGPRDLVVRIASGGGFVPTEYRLTELPQLSVHGDGRAITLGPTTEQYPPHALPNLQEARLTEADVQRILHDARAAGLLEGKVDYGTPTVMDAPATTIVVRADGATHTTTVYALGIDAGGLSDSQRAARRRVSAFVTKAESVASSGATRPYPPRAIAVYVTPYRGAATMPAGTSRAWPLGDLASVGAPSAIDPSYRCLVVRGTNAVTVLEAATRTSTTTLWHSGPEEYLLLFRPLLPDESTCK